MAALYDNSVEAFNATASTTLESASFAVGGSNRVLYVFVATGAGTPVVPSAVKWGGSGGTSLTQIGSTLDHHANGKFSVWRLIAPTSQTSTVHVTWGSAQDERYFIAISVKDADQTTPNGTIASTTGSSAAPSVNATTVSGDLVLSGTTFLDTGGEGFTLTTSDTSRQEIEGADLLYEGMGVSEKTATGTTTTMAWTISSSAAWGIFAFSINGASAGAYTLTADSGTFTETGVAASTLKHSVAIAGTGDIVLTGVNANLTYSGNPGSTYTLTAQVGQFIQNGYDVTLTYSVPNDITWDRIAGNEGYRIEWGQTSGGPYPNTSDNGTNDETITLVLPYRTTWYLRVAALVGGVPQSWAPELVFTSGIPDLNADVSSFTLTGPATGLYLGRATLPEVGPFVLNGVTTGLFTTRVLTAEVGSFAHTGVAANLVYSPTGGTYTLTASVGAIALTGIDTGVLVGYTLSANSSTFTLGGLNNSLIYSGAPGTAYRQKTISVKMAISL